jgi:dipeptidyl aminopeptidase/acylaminoacyl peptidase
MHALAAVLVRLVRFWRPLLAGAVVGALPSPGRCAPAAKTDAIDETVAAFFRPFLNDVAVMAPDGRRVAVSEQQPGKPPGIAVVQVDDRTSRSYPIDDGDDYIVRQIQWVSPTRLVFTTRGRAVGVLDVAKGEIEALLRQRDIDLYAPEPELGTRRYSSVTTPDMPANTLATSEADTGIRTYVSLREVLAQARVTGDMFSAEARPTSARLLRPFLVGAKPGKPHLVHVEIRDDADLFSARSGTTRRITVPGNVYVQDQSAPPPASAADLGSRPALTGETAYYDVTQRPPPLVLLELDTQSGRVRELARDDDWRRVWLDRAGRLRLVLEQKGRRFRYLHRESESKKWVPLDSIVQGEPALGFAAEAATLLGPRSVPLGFDAGGSTLFIATNAASDTYVLRALDLASGRCTDLEAGHSRYDLIEPTALLAPEAVRLDPYSGALAAVRFGTVRRESVWFDAGMKQLQATLAKQLAPRRVELLQWTEDRSRFLIEASGPGDPGSFHFVDVAAGKIIRCGERAPWLPEERRNAVHVFDFPAADGRRVVGMLTRPRVPRVSPPPVLVYFHDGPWFADGPVFNRGAQALAALGFAVLQINHRGSSGLGRAHLQAIDGGLDRAVLEDVRAVLERGKDGALGINTRMVAALGNGIGGYLAVRMTQLAPETFRCAVAINAPGDLEEWRRDAGTTRSLLADLRPVVFGRDREKLRAQSAIAAAATTRAPVLVVHAAENSYVPAELGRGLFRALKKGSPESVYLELPDEDHGGWSTETTAKLFAELGRFFNATIYAFGVEMRRPEVVK